MRIVIDARILRTSTGRYVERLLHYLQEVDHQNHYTVLLLQKDYDGWQPSAANFTKVVADFPIYSWQEQLGLGRLLGRLKPDLVHFTMPQQPLAYSGRAVTTVHDLTLLDFINRRPADPVTSLYKYSLKPAVFRWLLKRAVDRSAAVIVPTNYIRERLQARYRVGDKVVVTPEAAEIPATNPQTVPSLENQKFVLFVGNAYPHKNIARLIEAANALPADTKLVLGGQPDYFWEELKAKAAQPDRGNIVFIGRPDDAELVWLYQHATAYVFPSLSEGFSITGLEAMSYGLPVISSNASCLPEVYGDAAVYFDPTNVEDMRKVISSTLGDTKRLAELKKLGISQAKKYSWKRMAEQTLAVYKDALK